MHASALYVANVNIPASGLRNVVYAATEHDSVYAFDADGLSATPLWKTSFINPAAGVTTVPGQRYRRMLRYRGRNRHYRHAGHRSGQRDALRRGQDEGRFRRATNYVQRLHALDIATGAEKFGGPVVIQASVSGNGAGSVGGQIAVRSAARESASGAAAEQWRRLHGVRELTAISSRTTDGCWDTTRRRYSRSWRTTLHPMAAAAASGRAAAGLSGDAAGNVYFMTGNGTFDANTGGVNFGDSFVKLSPTGIGGRLLHAAQSGRPRGREFRSWDRAGSRCCRISLECILIWRSVPARTRRSTWSIGTTWGTTIRATTTRLSSRWSTSSRTERRSRGTTTRPCTSTVRSTSDR